jgi:hypothetical protein
MKQILSIILIFNCLFITNNSFAQTLIYKENKEKAKLINQKIPVNKSLIVFESNLDLGFDSSMEFLDSPKRDGNLYYLEITPQACLITIRNLKLKILTNIPFGQLTSNSSPTLRNGEVRYFTVSTADKLNLFDNTEKAKASGNSDNQMLYEKEALLIFTTDPVDMKLEFTGSVKITDNKYQDNRYLIYIQTKNQVITLKEKGSGAIAEIVIADINVKDVKYYFVSLPDYLKKNNKIPSTPDEFLALAYSDNKIGNTKNALNDLLEYVARVDHKYIEPYMMLYDLLLKVKGESETINYFDEFYKKEQSQFSQFMLYYARKDFDNIKKMALNYPDFLPAKIYMIKNEAPFYKEVGYQLQAGTSKTNICAVWEGAEKLQDDIEKINQCKKSDYFLKLETIHNLITPEEKQDIEGWGLWRKRNFNGLINLYLKEIKGNSDIKRKDYVIDSCVGLSSECAESDRIFVGKLYDEIIKNSPQSDKEKKSDIDSEKNIPLDKVKIQLLNAIPDELIVKKTIDDSEVAIFSEKCIVFSDYSEGELAEKKIKCKSTEEWGFFFHDYSHFNSTEKASTKPVSKKKYIQFQLKNGSRVTVDRAKSAGKLFFFNPNTGVKQCEFYSYPEIYGNDY